MRQILANKSRSGKINEPRFFPIKIRYHCVSIHLEIQQAYRVSLVSSLRSFGFKIINTQTFGFCCTIPSKARLN